MKLDEAWVQEVIDNRLDGVELVDFEVGGSKERPTLRVFVDSPQGVDHELCVRVSEILGGALDEGGYGDAPYTLEVSSPGLERRLKRRDHFEAQVGRDIYVKTSELVAGRKVWRGRLDDVQGEYVVLCADGETVSIELSQIVKAHVIFQF